MRKPQMAIVVSPPPAATGECNGYPKALLVANAVGEPAVGKGADDASHHCQSPTLPIDTSITSLRWSLKNV